MPFESAEQVRSFQFFNERTAPLISDFFEAMVTQLFSDRTQLNRAIIHGRSFWTVLTPQLSHVEPAVRRSVIAISTLHEALELSCTPSQDNPVFVSHYMKAITLLRSEWHKLSVDMVLVSCLVFAMYEFMQGSTEAGEAHLMAGGGIIRERKAAKRLLLSSSSKKSPDSELFQAVAPLFESFIAKILRYEAGFDEKHAVSDSHQLCHYGHRDQKGTTKTRPKLTVPPIRIHVPFSSIHQALGTLDSIMQCLGFLLYGTDARPTPDVAQDMRNLVDNWLTAFDQYERSVNEGAGMKFNRACTLLRVHAYAIRAMARESPLQMDYDNREADFEASLDQLDNFIEASRPRENSSPNLTSHQLFGVGLINPLFFVATKCRVPHVRQRAIKTLRRMKIVDGSWNTCVASNLADAMFDIEACGEKNRASWCIPEHRRITLIVASLREDGRLVIRFRKPRLYDQADETHEHVVERLSCSYRYGPTVVRTF